MTSGTRASITNITDDTMPSLTWYLNININLFYLIFGNIGNILKIAFFLQKPLRSLPCTVYILFSTISDFVTLNNLPFRQVLIHLYPQYHWMKTTVDWSNSRNESVFLTSFLSTHDVLMCKIRSYLHMLSTDFSSQMLVFASINRFCFSYCRRKRQTRHVSWMKIFCHFSHARKLCLFTLLICALISTHHLWNFTIDSPSEGCIPRNNILWTVWILSIHSFLFPISMIVFGILTLTNLRSSTVFGLCHPLRRRHRHKKNQFIQMCSFCFHYRNSTQYQIDHQLTSMIISEMVVTIVTALPYGSYALYHLLYGLQVHTRYYSYRTEWIELLIRMSMYFEASCGFYIYLITLTTLRKRFCKKSIQRINFNVFPFSHCMTTH